MDHHEAEPDEESTHPLVVRDESSLDRQAIRQYRRKLEITEAVVEGGGGEVRLTVRQLLGVVLLSFMVGASLPVLFRQRNLSSASSSPASSVSVQDNEEDDYYSKDSTTTEESTMLPKTVLLMSFPNSGTSYTLNLVSVASGMSVASNYGDEHTDPTTGLSMPVYGNKTNVVYGPYWINENDDNPRYPTRYILAKTHCQGFCNGCRPSKYVMSPRNFLAGCLETRGVEGSNNNDNNNNNNDDDKVVVHHQYTSMDLVGKTIHLIRDPLDNLVSRFHLEQHKLAKKQQQDSATNGNDSYPSNRQGFRTFCANLHTKENDRQKVDPSVLRLVKDVPCHLDLFRYIQWHNLAFIVTQDFLTVPTKVVRYEDYYSNNSTSLEHTTLDLLRYLELPRQEGVDLPPFYSDAPYHDYFTQEERQAIQQAAHALSSHETWHHIHRYFID